MAVKMSWAGLLGATIAYMIVAQVVYGLGVFLDLNYYMDPAYFPVWSKIMMPSAGPPPIEFTYFSVIFSMVSGFLFGLVYAVVRPSVPGKKWRSKGLMYGFLVFLVAGIPSTLMLVLLVNLPLGLLLSWLFQALVVYLIGGLIAARLIK